MQTEQVKNKQQQQAAREALARQQQPHKDWAEQMRLASWNSHNEHLIAQLEPPPPFTGSDGLGFRNLVKQYHTAVALVNKAELDLKIARAFTDPLRQREYLLRSFEFLKGKISQEDSNWVSAVLFDTAVHLFEDSDFEDTNKHNPSQS